MNSKGDYMDLEDIGNIQSKGITKLNKQFMSLQDLNKAQLRFKQQEETKSPEKPSNDLNVMLANRKELEMNKKGTKNLISWQAKTNPDNAKFNLKKYSSYNDLGDVMSLPKTFDVDKISISKKYGGFKLVDENLKTGLGEKTNNKLRNREKKVSDNVNHKIIHSFNSKTQVDDNVFQIHKYGSVRNIKQVTKFKSLRNLTQPFESMYNVGDAYKKQKSYRKLDINGWRVSQKLLDSKWSKCYTPQKLDSQNVKKKKIKSFMSKTNPDQLQNTKQKKGWSQGFFGPIIKLFK